MIKVKPLDLNPILRRLDSIEKKQDLQDQDRKLLEDISIQLANIDSRLKIVEDNIRNSRKDIKEDIANVGEQVVTSLDNMATEVANTPTIGIKTNWWGKIKLKLKGGEK